MVIEKDLMLLGLEANSKEEVIEALCTHVCRQRGITDRELFAESVYEREGIGNTYMANGFAIPHGKSEALSTPFMALAQLEKPVAWNENGDMAELVFMIGVPAANEDNIHLKMIAGLCRRLVDETLVQSLKKRHISAEEVSKLINQS